MSDGMSRLARTIVKKMGGTNENVDQIVLGAIQPGGGLLIDAFSTPFDDYLIMNGSALNPGRVVAAWINQGTDLIVLGYVGEVPT